MSDIENESPRAKRPLIRRVFRWGIILVVVLLLADFLLLPLGIAVYAAWPAGADVGEPPEGFRAIDVTATDGTRLAAWYAPSENGAAIILVPGAGGSRKGLREQAEMLAANGFGVLALDPRGAGESDGQSNRFGWMGTQDVGGAMEFLEAQPDVQIIGAWGFSMGGEVLLGALGDFPQIAAVITDGATARCYEEKLTGGTLEKAHSWLTYSFVALFTGDETPTPIMESLQANDSSRLLLIAAGDVQDEIDYNTMFAQASEGRAELWVVPDVGHTDGWDEHRDAYTRRVLDFFAEVLD